MTTESKTKLGNESTVTVALLIVLVMAAITGTVAAVRAVDKLDVMEKQGTTRDTAITGLAAAVSDLQRSVDKLTDATDLRLWIAEFGRLNPSVVVPALGGPFDGRGQRK